MEDLIYPEENGDTSKHRYHDPRRDQDSEPWHDLHAMIKGPIVWDLAYHFNQRWAYHEVKDEKGYGLWI